MFTDHMFFSGATEMFWILVMLTSVVSYRVQCFNKVQKIVLLRPMPGFSALSNPICFVALRSNRSACSSNNFRPGALLARKVLDLFPSCSGPATGEEETSC